MFLLFRILADISVLLILAKFGNRVIQLKCYLLGMLTDPEKTVRKIVFLFFLFRTKSKIADESHVALKSFNCFADLFQGNSLPWTYVDYILVCF